MSFPEFNDENAKLKKYSLQSYKHFDPAITANMSAKELDQFDFIVGTCACELADRTSFKTTGRDWAEFPMNAEGITYLEEYVQAFIVPRVLKWEAVGAGVKFTRIITSSGVSSASQKNIDKLGSWLFALAQFFAYCLARENGGTVAVEGGLRVIPANNDDLTCFPFNKFCKFICFGREDSLVSFVTVVRNRLRNQGKIVQLRTEIGCSFPNTREQHWFDEATGDLSRFCLLDKATNALVLEIHVAEVQ